MATFILSINWTDQGIRNVRDAPKRSEAAKELAKKVGVEIKQVYLTSGEHDILVIAEAPLGDHVTRFALALGSLGNVRTCLHLTGLARGRVDQADIRASVMASDFPTGLCAPLVSPGGIMGRRSVALINRGISQIAICAAIAMVMSPAPGRDLDGRYRNSPLHEWFESLASGKGLCCLYADGHAVDDVDWEARDGHYRVRLPKNADSKEMIWVDVPDDAIITVPNKAGRTMVWPVYNDFYPEISIRCFMPGSMT